MNYPKLMNQSKTNKIVIGDGCSVILKGINIKSK